MLYILRTAHSTCALMMVRGCVKIAPWCISRTSFAMGITKHCVHVCYVKLEGAWSAQRHCWCPSLSNGHFCLSQKHKLLQPWEYESEALFRTEEPGVVPEPLGR